MGRGRAEIHFQHAASESGTIRKIWKGKTSVVLVYPNHYAVGLPNLGFQAVYSLLNRMDTVVCERAFLPDVPGPAVSVESGFGLNAFDIIAFSISFENDYLNLPFLLQHAGIPLRSAQRDDAHPLVIAGGVACFINPEPVAHFIDCFLIGEAECLLPPFMDAAASNASRSRLLEVLAERVPGAYIPAFYADSYGPDGVLASVTPVGTAPRKIRRVYLSDLSDTPTQSAVITPHASFGNKYLIEVSRGCPHGCRFCSAGFVYRPPRFRPMSLLADCVGKGAETAARIGLVGAAVSDHPDLSGLCDLARAADVQLSFSSLRADALNEGLVAALAQSRIQTATIAPDAGSERMRRVINKGLTETQILNAASLLVSAGIPNLKLYFMVGLPTETTADVEAIVSLCQKVKEAFLESSREKGHMGVITVSVNAFIPKPATPFQWSPMDEMPVLKKKLAIITGGLKRVPNVRVEVNSFKDAVIQALLSRGDRRLSELLVRVVNHRGNWRKAIGQMPDFSLASYIHRQRSFTEVLPWDHIDNGVRKSFLENECRRAMAGKVSAPCPMSGCRACGACDESA